ncbi:FHA domain-containing protein [Candidatus Amarolinea dominans]|uniref:FHA domain-containing protein n=1 Tax=Candidatus Amarolinea dominans TaxID=3140696 RepID=UPI0031347197|nr:FHA domain-containing protein [Anaerolineae bacterium]
MLPQLAVAPVAGPGLAAQLRAEQGPLAGQTFAISRSPFTLGRSPENDLVLPEPLASRQHVRLEARAGRWYVIDLDSANGTLLNRQRLSGEMALNAGDLMAIGDTVFAFDAAPAPPAAVPPVARARPTPRRSSPLAAIVIGVVLIALVVAAVLFLGGSMRRTADDATGPALPTLQLPTLPTIVLPTGVPSLPPIPTGLPSLPTGLPSLPTFPPLR